MPGENFVLLVDVARVNFKVNPFLHGSARWADLSDIKAAGLLNNDGVYVGAWRDRGGKIHYLRHAGPEHVLLLRSNAEREGGWPHCADSTFLEAQRVRDCMLGAGMPEIVNIKFCASSPPRHLVPVVLTRWMNCVLGQSTK